MAYKQEKGRVHVYAGDGKGKTTAAVGLAVRAASYGWRVLFVQYLKDGHSGEIRMLRNIPEITVVTGFPSGKFTFQMNDQEKAETRAFMMDRFHKVVAEANSYDLIVMDETLGSIHANMLDENEVIDFMKNKPAHVELVLTGRDPSEALIAATDYYTEMVMRKHPFVTEGLEARIGVEY